LSLILFLFFFYTTSASQLYSLSLHDALPILASLLVRLVVLLPFQLLRLSLATPSRWTPLALSVFLHCVVALLLTLLRKTESANRSEERFSRNAETDLVCRLLLEKKNKAHRILELEIPSGAP